MERVTWEAFEVYFVVQADKWGQNRLIGKKKLSRASVDEEEAITYSPVCWHRINKEVQTVTEAELDVTIVIYQCFQNSAPGPDRIFPAMLLVKHLHPNAITYLTSLYNRISQSGSYLSNWTSVIALPTLILPQTPRTPSHSASH